MGTEDNGKGAVDKQSLEYFIERRRDQRDWAALNGYYNGKLETNGEYAVVQLVAKRCLHRAG